MTRELIANAIASACDAHGISEEDKECFEIMTRQELIECDGEDEDDPLYGDNYEWVVIFKEHPDYYFISGETISGLDGWFKDLRIGKYDAVANS